MAQDTTRIGEAGGEQARDAEEVTLAAKVAFLSRPGSYPEAPASVEAVETRLSWVFLTPSRAWKLKKPLRYDHVDFHSLAARRHDCEEEIRLNRPLAPGVYLAVEPLGLAADGALCLGGEERVVDYLVCMRRVPRADCLEERIATGRVDAAAVERAGRTLAEFYRRAPVAGRVDVDTLLRQVEDEAASLHAVPMGGDDAVADLRARLRAGLERCRESLAARSRREVHGDLRPQHVYLGEPPLFLDRLTFHEELRLMDPVEELAFLALDCERLGAAWIGERFLAVRAEITGDRPPAELVALYRARRALLWALLSARHLLRGGSDHPWRERALAYLRLGIASLE